MGNVKTYDTERSQSEDAVKYVFVSTGKADIVKAIQYRYVQDFLGRRLYNLGFGDYDIATDEISDDSNSNNGDMYAVFYTVLNTIQNFFETFPTAMLMVEGSDSTPEFEAQCRKSCRRKCGNTCKKRNQRIIVYREYVNKKFSGLKNEYTFYGGLDIGNETKVEHYEPYKEYIAVFLQKR